MSMTAAAIGVVFLTVGALLTRFIKRGGLGSGARMRKLPIFPPSPKPRVSSTQKNGDTPTVLPQP